MDVRAKASPCPACGYMIEVFKGKEPPGGISFVLCYSCLGLCVFDVSIGRLRELYPEEKTHADKAMGEEVATLRAKLLAQKKPRRNAV